MERGNVSICLHFVDLFSCQTIPPSFTKRWQLIGQKGRQLWFSEHYFRILGPPDDVFGILYELMYISIRVYIYFYTGIYILLYEYILYYGGQVRPQVVWSYTGTVSGVMMMSYRWRQPWVSHEAVTAASLCASDYKRRRGRWPGWWCARVSVSCRRCLYFLCLEEFSRVYYCVGFYFRM